MTVLRRFTWNGKDNMGFVLVSRTLSTNPGSNTVIFHTTVMRRIIQVSRSGFVYDIITGIIATPTNRQCWVRHGGNIFQFAEQFNPGETIMIKWKT